eukprot:scaffold292839_cov35-Tisochrysis_lutea.AAC.1
MQPTGEAVVPTELCARPRCSAPKPWRKNGASRLLKPWYKILLRSIGVYPLGIVRQLILPQSPVR